MDLTTKYEDSTKNLVQYNSNTLSGDNLRLLKVINIPYEVGSNGPTERSIQSRINSLPSEIKSKIEGYTIQMNAASLVRTSIARLTLFEKK